MTTVNHDFVYIVLTFVWLISTTILVTVSVISNKTLSAQVERSSYYSNKIKISRIIGETCIAGTIGVITYLLCSLLGVDPIVSAASSGALAHIGTRTVFCIENILMNRCECYK